ncbi:unnamed protein product, partial [Ranitomeya imitator]
MERKGIYYSLATAQ